MEEVLVNFMHWLEDRGFIKDDLYYDTRHQVETFLEKSAHEPSDLVISPYGALPCELQVFSINGTEAEYKDFGDTHIGGDCYDGTCHCEFISKPSTKDVLEKYSITEYEYQYICSQLEQALLVRACGWCS